MEVVGALSVRPPETVRRNVRWLNVDSHSYLAAFEFEDAIDRWGLPGDLSDDEREAVGADLSEWRSALPFTDAERRLILDVDAIAGSPEISRQIIGKTVILDDGEIKEASGRELMQRWWKWRRGVDQFKEGDGVERGRQAVYQFAGHLLGPHLPLIEEIG
jgi:hypothetical protein